MLLQGNSSRCKVILGLLLDNFCHFHWRWISTVLQTSPTYLWGKKWGRCLLLISSKAKEVSDMGDDDILKGRRVTYTPYDQIKNTYSTQGNVTDCLLQKMSKAKPFFIKLNENSKEKWGELFCLKQTFFSFNGFLFFWLLQENEKKKRIFTSMVKMGRLQMPFYSNPPQTSIQVKLLRIFIFLCFFPLFIK